MRREFKEFHRPNEREFQQLWDDAIVVVDTNVLLQLYRVPKASRDETVAVLRAFGSRLWIPFHVALEFQRNRLKVIAAERKALEGVLSDSKRALDNVIENVEKIELDKRGIEVEEEPIRTSLRDAAERVSSALEKARQAQALVSHDDPIRDVLCDLLEGRVGSAPDSQDHLDKIFTQGEQRYIDRVPPGFLDDSKGDGAGEATFVAGGLKYQKKYGDLLIWKQLLEHARSKKVKRIIFVTSDNKEDWWLRYQGQTLGPLPELISEARRNEVEDFWMYSFFQFMEQASQRSKVKVSTDTLNEAREVDRLSSQGALQTSGMSSRHAKQFSRAQAEFAVTKWLQQRGINAQSSGDLFPDLVARSAVGIAGYEIIQVDSFSAPEFLSRVVSVSREAIGLLADGSLDEMHIFVVVKNLDELSHPAVGLERLEGLLSSIGMASGISSISAGYVWDSKFHLFDQFVSKGSRLHGSKDFI